MPGRDSLAAAHVPITVLLVDDQELIRRGLAVLLDSVDDIAVVGEAADTATAVRVAMRTRPDVVLVDSSMPSSAPGLEACRELLHAVPNARVVLLAGGDDAAGPPAWAGAAACLRKDAPIDDLCAAVRVVADGRLP